MENKLKQLFEYQKFNENKHLSEQIKSLELEESKEILDESLYAVAGGKKQEDRDKQQ